MPQACHTARSCFTKVVPNYHTCKCIFIVCCFTNVSHINLTIQIRAETDIWILKRDIPTGHELSSSYPSLWNLTVQEKEDAHLTEWDRFARTEYIRLAMEEEGEDARTENGRNSGGWESSLEAPF